MWLKVIENVVQVSNSLDSGETLKYSGVSSGSKLFAYGTIVTVCGLKLLPVDSVCPIAKFEMHKVQ